MTKSFRILGTKWVVKLGDSEVEGPLREKGEPLHGATLFKDDVIWIDKNTKPTRRQATLFHELLHIAVAESGTKWKERDIESVSAMLFTMLRDNGLWKNWTFGKK